jgi:hypothetical protein
MPCAIAQALQLMYSFVMRSFKSSLRDARGPQVFQGLVGFAFCAAVIGADSSLTL